MTLTLPYPPSMNTYWRRNGHRYFIAPAGVTFRLEVETACIALGARPFAGPVSVSVLLVPGDRRRRDVDNPIKPLLDALTHAGAWGDDSQVARLLVERADPEPRRGRCVVEVSAR